MGGLCSRRSTDDGALAGTFPHVNGHFSYGSGLVYQSRGFDVRENSSSVEAPSKVSTDKQLREPISFPELNAISHATNIDDINDGIPHLSRALSNKSRSSGSKQVAIAKVFSPLILF